MDLVRLIYASKVSACCDFKALHSILTASMRNNPKRGLTGVLCYDPQYFLQWLEGPVEEVHALYSLILQDARHNGSLLLDNSPIRERFFPDWAMAYLSTQVVDRKRISEFTGGKNFNPLQFDAATASAFLIKLAHSKGQPLESVSINKLPEETD